MSNLINKLMVKTEEDIHACVDEKMTYAFFDGLSYESKSVYVYKDRDASLKEAAKREKKAEESLRKLASAVKKYDRPEDYANAVCEMRDRLAQRLVDEEEHTPMNVMRDLEALAKYLTVDKLKKRKMRTDDRLDYVENPHRKSGLGKGQRKSSGKARRRTKQFTKVTVRRPARKKAATKAKKRK